MKFEIDFDQMPDYVLIQTREEATVDGFDDLLTALVESPQWVPGTAQIIDHRRLGVNNLALNDMAAIMGIVKRHSKKLGPGPCAFVVKDALGFGIARMYELIGGDDIHPEVKVFYTVDEAVQWLKE